MTIKAPKTGLAKQMRAWMRARGKSFTVQQLRAGLETSPDVDRDKVWRAMLDFIRRGEISVKKQKRRQPVYVYNHAWKPQQKGRIQTKIYKAMRLLNIHGAFAVADVQRLTGCYADYICKLTKRLYEEGYLRIDGSRLCAHGAGKESLYRLVSPDRFRLEVMR